VVLIQAPEFCVKVLTSQTERYQRPWFSAGYLPDEECTVDSGSVSGVRNSVIEGEVARMYRPRVPPRAKKTGR
jgi:hypothetical protein